MDILLILLVMLNIGNGELKFYQQFKGTQRNHASSHGYVSNYYFWWPFKPRCRTQCTGTNQWSCSKNGRCNGQQPTCVSYENLCNGELDCPNEYDERDCWSLNDTWANCYFLKRSNNKDILSNQTRCNYFLRSYGWESDTNLTQTQNRSSIPREINLPCPLCDQKQDCWVEGDEFHDELYCSNCSEKWPLSCSCYKNGTKNECVGNGQICYGESQKCNKWYDCVDLSDEDKCEECDQKTYFTCACSSSSSTRCSVDSPRCYAKKKYQNCIKDCSDGSDEIPPPLEVEGCSNNILITISSSRCSGGGACDPNTCYRRTIDPCNRGEYFLCGSKCDEVPLLYKTGFQCKDKKIESAYRFCDGQVDCLDKSDEINKSEYGFKCKGLKEKCTLPQINLFDTGIQCHDELDRCPSADPNSCFYKCTSKKHQIYVSTKQVCDGVFDCFDRSDECLCGSKRKQETWNQCLKTFSSPAKNCKGINLGLIDHQRDSLILSKKDFTSSSYSIRDLALGFGIFGVVSPVLSIFTGQCIFEFKITKQLKYQYFVMMNILVAEILKAVYLIQYSTNIQPNTVSSSKSTSKLGISCSVAGGLLISATEASILFVVLLSSFRKYILAKPKIKNKRYWFAAIGFVWIVSFALGFGPLAIGFVHFYSETLFFEIPLLSNQTVWSRSEVRRFACRLATISNIAIEKNEWSITKKFVEENYLRNNFLKSFHEYEKIGSVDACLLNHFAYLEPSYNSYIIFLIILNLFGFIASFVCVVMRIMQQRNHPKTSSSTTEYASKPNIKDKSNDDGHNPVETDANAEKSITDKNADKVSQEEITLDENVKNEQHEMDQVSIPIEENNQKILNQYRDVSEIKSKNPQESKGVGPSSSCDAEVITEISVSNSIKEKVTSESSKTIEPNDIQEVKEVDPSPIIDLKSINLSGTKSVFDIRKSIIESKIESKPLVIWEWIIDVIIVIFCFWLVIINFTIILRLSDSIPLNYSYISAIFLINFITVVLIPLCHAFFIGHLYFQKCLELFQHKLTDEEKELSTRLAYEIMYVPWE